MLHSTGYDVPCYVVRVTAADRKDPTSFGESATETLWIDRKTGVVWERRQHDDSFILSASSRTPVTVNSFTRYSTVQLGTTVPETLFHFDPPASAASVAQFSEFRLRLDMTGLPAPDVQLVSADGSVVPLSSFRGKPVLLDFWSIHCKPCVEGMPKIDEIAKKTAANGLVVLSVNEDLLMGVREEEEKKKAIDFFAQHNYTWPDFFDEGTVHQSFNMLALPHLVLIDSQGTIVYFRGDQDELLTAIASLGPQYEFLRPVPKPQDSCAIAAKQIPPN